MDTIRDKQIGPYHLTATLVVEGKCQFIQFEGGAFGSHRILRSGHPASDTQRLAAHWQGYKDATQKLVDRSGLTVTADSDKLVVVPE